jgi:hypothetical protein
MKHWNLRVEDNGGASALNQLKQEVTVEDLGAAGNKLCDAVAELTKDADDNRVCIITSGHVRDDGTGYFGVSVTFLPLAPSKTIPLFPDRNTESLSHQNYGDPLPSDKADSDDA